MTYFRFENPSAFYWLLMIPILVLLNGMYFKMHQKKVLRFFSQKNYAFLASSLSPKRRFLKMGIEFIVIVLFVLALARPQSGQSEEKVKSEGVELMILFDVSRSMLAEDIKPSRIEFAKKEMMRLIDSGNDKVGVVAFAGSGILLSPLTTDKNALKMYIESLTDESISTQGTDFKGAFLEAKEAFRRGGTEMDGKTVVTRAIVVVSDGEDNEVGAMEALKQLKEQGIKVFTLAVGSEKGGPIPVRDEAGNVRGYRKDKEGQVILTQTKGDLLKKLAREGGGSFYHLSYSTDVIKQLRNDITKLEKAEFDSAMVVDYDEKFQLWLLLGILLAMIEIFIGERRAPGRVWQGRFEVAVK